MIRVTIELESAQTGEVTTIGMMCIANDAKGSKQRRDYDVAVMRRGTHKYAKQGRMPNDSDVTRYGKVRSYPAPAYNIWRLIVRALKSAFPEES